MSARLLLGAGALCIGFLSASLASAAISVTYNTTLPTNTGPGPAPTSVTGGTLGVDYYINVTGNEPDRLSPWDQTTRPDGAYHSIEPGVTATYSYGSDQTFFSIMWGSPDSGGSNRNVLTFYKDGAFVTEITGDDVRPKSTSNQTGSANGFANVIANFSDGDVFDEVRLTTGQVAYEWANAVVPLPAAGLLFATALAGMAWLRRRINVVTPAVT